MDGSGSRWLRILLLGAIAALSLTFWTFADVAYACDPDIEDCEPPDEEDPPETSPPHTSPPATSPPHTSPPATHPPVTHGPVTQAPAVGKTATTRSHTATTRRSSSGQSNTPAAEPFLEVPVAPTTPVDPGVQLPAVQLAGDAKAVPGVGTAAEAGLPPEANTSGGGGDPKLALALAAAGIALLGAPLVGRKSCDEMATAAVRSQIAAACWEVSTAKSDLVNANTRLANITAAIAERQQLAAAVQQAHAGIDAIRASRNWRWWGKRGAQAVLGGTAGVVGGASVGAGQAALAGARYTFLGGAGLYFGLPGADPVHSIDHLPEDMGAADFEAALAKAHADIDAKLGPPGALASLQVARDTAVSDGEAAAGRLGAAHAELQDAQARWNAMCGPTPACGA